jgi:hypothetical protein
MRIFTCNKCSRIHLEIGNVQIHFDTLEKLKHYSEYLEAIDVAYYAAINRSKGLSKEIISSFGNCNSIHLAFTTHEFEQLKATIRSYLLGEKSAYVFVHADEFQPVNWN